MGCSRHPAFGLVFFTSSRRLALAEKLREKPGSFLGVSMLRPMTSMAMPKGSIDLYIPGRAVWTANGRSPRRCKRGAKCELLTVKVSMK